MKKINTFGIYTRFAFIMIIMGSFLVFLLAALWYNRIRQERLISTTYEAQFKQEVHSIFELKTSAIKQVTYDYTFWDEFVDKVYSSDTAWFKNNITTILKSFHFDYVAVYDTNFNLIHEATGEGFVSTDFLPRKILKEIYTKRFLDFHHVTEDGIVQISAATIHTDTDPTHRLTRPRGVLVLGKRCDSAFLKELGTLCSAEARLLVHKPFEKDNDSYTTQTVVDLKSASGTPVAQIVLTRFANALVLMRKISVTMVAFLFISILITGLLLAFAIRKWIKEPFNLLKNSLATQEPLLIKKLSQFGGEYKDIGGLITDSIRQQEELRQEKERSEIEYQQRIAERLASEKKILALNENLDTLVKQRTAELEGAITELETFSYSVSHDLKTPLRHISGFIKLYLESIREPLSAEAQDYLNKISSAATEMDKLIDALLSFSRLNITEMHKTRILSTVMVQQVIRYFAPETQNRKIEFKVDEMPDILGDEDMIRQVWTNLISNAIKYTSKKEYAIVEIGSFTENQCTTFFIRDNGAGFNMKYADKLFGVFQRMHKVRDFEGIGIGLANVNRIVRRHGGRCQALGSPDQGATFSFTIPVEDA